MKRFRFLKYAFLISLLATSLCWGAAGDYKVKSDGTIYGYDFITKGPWVDPRAYGAIGGGIVNDAVAIQNSINSLPSSGGTLLVSKIYGLGSAGWAGISLSSKSKITIKSISKEGGFKVLATPSQHTGGSSQPCVFLLSNSSFIEMDGLDIDGNSIDSNLIGLDGTTDSTIKNNYLHDTGSADANGVYSENGNRNKYLENTIYNTGRGLWIGGTSTGDRESNALIEGNIVRSNQGTGIGGCLVDSVINGNISSENGGSGIALGSETTGIYERVAITNNVVRGNTYHGIQGDSIGTSFAREISIYGNECLENIESGIYAVNAHRWVIQGNVCTDNNHDGVGTGNGITVDYASHVSVMGNTVSDTRTGASRTQTRGIQVVGTVGSSSDIIISGNTAYNNLVHGIDVGQATPLTINRVSIIGNNASLNGSNGINVVDDVSGEITGIIVVGNITNGNTSSGIRIDNTITDYSIGNNLTESYNGPIPGNGTIEWDPGSLVDGAGETSGSITLTGAIFGDFIIVSAPYDLQGITATAYVAAANSVKIRLQNETGGTIDLVWGIWNVRVIK